MEHTYNLKTSTFLNRSGQHIFYRNWIPGDGKPKGIVIIIHGLNAHSGYYHSFALQLVDINYQVYAIDLRGRGRSQGERYYISDYNDILNDIDQLVDIAKGTDPSLPVFMLGHSAGGVFASVYAVQHQEKLDGLICESFAFHLPAPAFALATIKLLSYIFPHLRLVKLNNADFSRDPAMVYKLNSDPLLADEKQPAKTMQQLLLAGGYLKNNMSVIRVPVLILHGLADKATKPGGSEYFMEKVSSADKQLKLYEGHYHDLLNDKDKGIVISDIKQWLNERAPVPV
ncbi:alpha/beta hydrolase [Mucilaginibacter sp. UR6-1]|uniref:alpha/beta hydrolase n=1 Tax=Mucilaginibacter sp. UR6-1 TaxID=1435643 RepID=UPI001E5BF58F|nr:alpha/beta hydrolase [Mucilaginibacter sp. UR6-1]MCC8408548.1 alpha/beta hydrolase [Mucilaginibacter sp. UR6-1]